MSAPALEANKLRGFDRGDVVALVAQRLEVGHDALGIERVDSVPGRQIQEVVVRHQPRPALDAGLIAQRAVELRRQAGYEASFHAALLPYGIQADRDDALLAVTTIKPDFTYDLDIKPTVDAFAMSFETAIGEALADFDKGNAKARARMIAQYAIAGRHKLLVLGTDHAAEAVTGFYTKYGDGGADVFVHASAVERSTLGSLQEGQKIGFELERDQRSGKTSAGQLQAA